jgi:hypothetical protein
MRHDWAIPKLTQWVFITAIDGSDPTRYAPDRPSRFPRSVLKLISLAPLRAGLFHGENTGMALKSMSLAKLTDLLNGPFAN